MTTSTSRKTSTPPAQRAHERFGLYLWTGVVLAVALVVVILSWHARGGTTDPTDCPPGHQLSQTAVVQQRGAGLPRGPGDDPRARRGRGQLPRRQQLLRKPVPRQRAGGRGRCGRPGSASSGSSAASTAPGSRPGGDRDPGDHRAAARDELVLPQGLLDRLDLAPLQAPPRPVVADPDTRPARGCCSGSRCSASPRSTASASRSSLFLQNLRGSTARASCSRASPLGLLFTAAVGVLTFALHQRLPYKRLLIITGVCCCSC